MKVDRFKLEECVGKGSFGRVYKATDCHTGKKVALKFERVTAEYPQLAYEHRVYNLLKDVPGIPNTIGEVGTHRNYKYLAMDFFDTDLQREFRLSKYKFEPSFVRYVIKSVVEILERIHSLGLIHRDLKPGNMMYDKQNDQISVCGDWTSHGSIEGAMLSGYKTGKKISRELNL